MISTVTKTVDGTAHQLKFSSAALYRLEQDNGGRPFDDLVDSLISGTGGISLVASALSAGLNDGKGVDQDAAFDFIDACGGVREVLPFIAEGLNAAFPVAEQKGKGRTASGNAKKPAGK